MHSTISFAGSASHVQRLASSRPSTVSLRHSFLPAGITGCRRETLDLMGVRAISDTEASSEVTIRRRPPEGVDTQACGPVDFKVPSTDENKPRNILEEIVWHKAVEIEQMRQKVALPLLMAQAKNAPAPRDFIGALKAKADQTKRPGLIAEVKKASPSKGIIQPNFDPVKIAQNYEAGGAACLSVLTDSKFFQGGFENLQLIRQAGVTCPMLCKEFIVEAYQVFKARASGADAILLIAAVLPNSDMEYLIKSARSVGLQCLIEVHTVEELERMLALKDLEGCMLGINNRDLQTFKVDLANTEMIMGSAAGQEVLERGLIMASESGIFVYEDVERVQKAGCEVILVGESLVKQGDCKKGVEELLKVTL
jgi:indole-3-glycerol phosphate synthase